MAVNARFIADFASFQQAVSQAEVKLASFEQSGAKVEKSLTRMANSLSGTKLIQDATLMAAAVEKVGGAATLTAKELARIGPLVSEASAKLRATGQGVPESFKAITAAADASAKSVGGLATDVGSAILRLGGLTLTITGITTALVTAVKSAVAFASEINDLSQATGIGTEDLQALEFAGRRVGLELADLGTMMSQLSKRIATGDNNAVAAVQSLGLNLETLKRQSPEKVFEEIGKRVAAIKDPLVQAGIGAELFGRQYQGALKLVNDNLEETMKQAHAAGAVLKDEGIKALDELGDRAGDLTQRLKVLAAEGILGIVHAIEALAQAEEEQARQQDALASGRLAARPTAPATGALLSGLGGAANLGLTNDQLIANRLLALRTDALQKLSPLQKQQIADLEKWGVAEKEIAHLVGASESAVHLYTAALKEVEVAQKRFAEAEKNIAAALAGPGGLTIDQEIAIRQLKELGVSTSDIAQHLHVAEGAVNAYLKSWDELNQNIKESREIGAEAAKAIGEAFKGPLNVIKDLAIAMGNLPLAARQMEQQITQSIQLIAVAESGLAAQMRQGVGLMPDMSRQATQHMNELRIGIDHTDDAMLALVEAVQKFGIASGNAFGGLLVALPEIIKLLHDAKLAAAEAAIHPEDVALAYKAEVARKAALYGSIALGAGIVAQATAGSTSTGGIVAHGAATGASIGASVAPYLGPYGPAAIGIGAGVGAIVGLIQSGKEWHKVMSDVARDFGGLMVPKDFADSIKELESQTGLGRVQALTTQLDQLIKIAGGLRPDNFDLFFRKLHDAFSMLERGELSLVQTTQILDKNFADFAAAGTDAYGRVSDKILELIELNQRFGTQSKAIVDFLKQQASNAAAALGDLLTEPAIAAYDAIKKSVDEAQTAVDAAQGDAEKLAAAQQHLTDVLSMQFAESERAKAGLEDLGTAAVLAFNAAIASGDDFITALNKISPSLDTIQRAFKDLGLDIDNTALKGLTLENQILNGPGGTGKAIGGLNALFTAATNIPGLLTPGDFAAQQRVALGLYTQTQAATAAAGGGTINALLPFQQILHQAADFAAKNKIALDPMIQILIEQSKELGIWSDDFKSDSEKTRQSIGELIASNTDLAKALGGVTDALHAWTGGGPPSSTGGGNPPPAVPGGGGGGDDEAYRHSYGRGSGGVVDFGSGTRAILHDREIVLTEQQYRNLMLPFPAPPWMNDWNYRGGVIEPAPSQTYKPGPVDRKPFVLPAPQVQAGPVAINITVQLPPGSDPGDPEVVAGALDVAIREDRQFIRTKLETLARRAVL